MTRLRLPTYTVDLEELLDFVAELGAADTALEQLGTDLWRQIGRLHETWEGYAAASQLVAHQRWDSSLGDLRCAVRRLRRAASHAHGLYDDAVATNLRMWAQVT
ncbi:WXG100 family type VII secretion target [Nocardioides sp. KR10-350]|uniref:WXG100 family type VII secretion target n=1 Tax=Nocardioides cheoyonin TaxID=3156615 RepID=UPI0032B58CE7